MLANAFPHLPSLLHFLDDSYIPPESVLCVLKQSRLSQTLQEGHLIICMILLSSFMPILILFQSAFIMGSWDYM